MSPRSRWHQPEEHHSSSAGCEGNADDLGWQNQHLPDPIKAHKGQREAGLPPHHLIRAVQGVPHSSVAASPGQNSLRVGGLSRLLRRDI